MSSVFINRRIDLDVVKLVNSTHRVIVTDRRNEIEVVLNGPKGTIYESGIWRVLLTIPDKYPYKSPSVGFVNKIYHPNVDEVSGSVCLNVISHTWTALYDLNMIFDTFLPQLLAYPNPADPLNHEAATIFIDNPQYFKLKVSEYINAFASKHSLSIDQIQLDSDHQNSMLRKNRPTDDTLDYSSLSSLSENDDIDLNILN